MASNLLENKKEIIPIEASNPGSEKQIHSKTKTKTKKAKKASVVLDDLDLRLKIRDEVRDLKSYLDDQRILLDGLCMMNPAQFRDKLRLNVRDFLAIHSHISARISELKDAI